MLSDRETIWDTVRKHASAVRYLDATTAQVFQSIFLLALAVTLLGGEVVVKLGHSLPGAMWLYTEWAEIDLWSAAAGAAGIILVFLPANSNTARLVMWCICCYWVALAARLWSLFGWLPIASTFALVLALLAAWSYVRSTYTRRLRCALLSREGDTHG